MKSPRALVCSGSLLWSYPWGHRCGINVSQPIIGGQEPLLHFHWVGKGATLVEVARSRKHFSAGTIQENINMKNKFNSSVLHNEHVYGLDEGIVTCVEVNSGERK